MLDELIELFAEKPLDCEFAITKEAGTGYCGYCKFDRLSYECTV